jgi:hypothetical protein
MKAREQKKPDLKTDSVAVIFLTLRRQGGVCGRRRDGGVGALGRPARSLAAKCQTNLVLSVRPDSFREQSGMKAGRAHGYCRCLDRAKPRGPIACPRRQAEPRAVLRWLAREQRLVGYCCLADMRSIAASGIFGRNAGFAGLASLRPLERNEMETQPAKLE